jgi:hypothetical protein
MREPAALYTAFRGCGTTLETACADSGVSFNDYPAVLDLLGTHLMTSAANCLPNGLEPQKWRELLPSGQLAALEELMGRLTKPPSGRSHSRRPIAKRPLLPDEMGKWDSPRPLPSCLGMLVILAAYAHLTGNNALAASIQRMAAEPAVAGMEKLYSAAQKFARAHFTDSYHHDQLAERFNSCLEDGRAAMSRQMSQRLFHGAILFRIAGGQWVCVDPYMENFAKLYRPIERLWPEFANPTVAATILGSDEWDDLPQLEQLLGEICNAISGLLANRDHAESTENFARRVTAVAQGIGIPVTDWEGVLCYSVTDPPEWKVPDFETAMAIAACADSAQRRRLHDRILMIPLHLWAERVWACAQRTRASEPHQSMLIANLPRSLAVWVVINLRHRNAGGLLAADLLEYSSSDIVLLNALMDQDGLRTTRADDAMIFQRQARALKTPDHMAHPLMAAILSGR